MIIKLLGRGGNAGLIKSCVIMRNIFCLLGNTELQGMCVLPPEMLGARMSFFQKQNRRELKGKRGEKKTRKRKREKIEAKPNKCLTGHGAAVRALKSSQGKFPEKPPSAQVGIPHPLPLFGSAESCYMALFSPPAVHL